MKIIGIITAFGCQDWIEPSIRQAIRLCDEVFVCVNAHSSNLLKFKDRTLDITKRYSPYINIIDYNNQATHFEVKSDILNTCLRESWYFDIGSWIWVLDVDEFWDDMFCMQSLRKILNDSPYDQICVAEKYFYINMQHYLKSEHNRFFRINSPYDRFYPMQRWSGTKSIGHIKDENIFFHYCMLLNPHMKLEQWRTEYPNKSQQDKIDWLNKIYKNYDLDNEDYWIKENERLFGIKSPLLNKSAMPNTDGKLFKYNDKHPKVIEESGLTNIEDFRKYYKF